MAAPALHRPDSGAVVPAVIRRVTDQTVYYDDTPFPTPFMELRKNGKWRIYYWNPREDIRLQHAFGQDFLIEDDAMGMLRLVQRDNYWDYRQFVEEMNRSQ